MTRAKDISKIITDADLSGTLDVTGTVTAGGLTVDTDAYRRLLLTYPDAFTSKLQVGFSNFYVQGSATTDELTIANNSSGQTKFINQSKTSMLIDNSGDISFYEDTGTTPKLFWDSSAERLKIGDSSANTAGGLVVGSDTGGVITVTKNGGTYAQNDLIGSLNWYTEDASLDGPNVTARIAAFANGVSGDDAYLTFSTKAQPLGADAAESMRIDISGRVGIGTIPDDKLHVVDDANAELKLQTDNANGGSVIKFNRSGTDNSYIGTKGYFTGTSDNNLYLRANSGLGIQFYTNGNNERMRLDSSGRVGIGATALGANLNILGANSDTWAASATNGLALNGNTAVSTITSYLDSSSIRIGAGVTQKTGIVITGQSTGSGSTIQFRTGNSERMRIRATGNVGIGTSDPDSRLDVATGANGVIFRYDTASTFLQILPEDANGDISLRYRANSGSAPDLLFKNDGGTERMRITNGGNVGIGTSSPSGRIEAYNASGDTNVYITTANTNSSTLFFGDTDSATIGRIQYDHSTNRMRFHTNGSERMRIESGGNIVLGKTTVNTSVAGVYFSTTGSGFTRGSGSVAFFNRQSNDGQVIGIGQADSTEGSISVSGSTVSYNGGHLSRWSRLLDNSKDTTIVKGTVMTNLDEMVEWGDEDNEQLNKMAVSSVEGDVNVAGVFVNWDNDDDWNDMNIAMTGDMVIRIAQGTTVARGDLLMSAGDGTAKPQGDDIVRSKTIAKVTSTNVSHTYDDGTYLVPCVLMAC